MNCSGCVAYSFFKCSRLWVRLDRRRFRSFYRGFSSGRFVACSELPVTDILTVCAVDSERSFCEQNDEYGSFWAYGVWDLCVCVLVSVPRYLKMGKPLRKVQPRVQYISDYRIKGLIYHY